jgi:DNA-binding SARP family transcriptional activator
LLSLLFGLAALVEGRGQYGKAIETLKRALTGEPVSEETHAGLMRVYASSGQRGEAFRQYDRLQEQLWREFGAEPDSAVQQLRDDVMAGKRPVARSPSEDPFPSRDPHVRRTATATSTIGGTAD